MTDVRVAAFTGAQPVLTPQAVQFVADLHRRFAPERDALLAARTKRREGGRFDFLDETGEIREAQWSVAPAPPDLRDRRVEITGPTERKMSINALNSGASVWLADHEDANTPHWRNVLFGQLNLYDAVRRTITYAAEDGREYALADGALPTIVMRPRGWHLDERHILVDDDPGVAALVDFGLYFFHNARELIARDSGPYFYLPKMESHREARLWNDVFDHAQDALDIPRGTIRATVLIETLPAAFEMDEILYELRTHASGLNAGRWDYLFSVIKNLRGTEYVLPDRGAVTMTAPFMRAYTELLVATCHRRGAFAMGGMAAFIPNRRDPEVTSRALAKVREDKEREARDGFDGSWVAHPDLVPLCKEVFDAALGARSNQLDRRRDDVQVTAGQLLDVAATPGQVTEAGVRTNISVGLRYLAAWLDGTGAVALDNLMEDAATAEISRCQLWQWLRHEVHLDTGERVTPDLVRRLETEELARIGEPKRLDEARDLFDRAVYSDELLEFLTIPAYNLID